MTKLERAAQAWHKAKTEERRRATGLYEAIRDAVAAGMSESECARVANVDRLTVRRALGKG